MSDFLIITVAGGALIVAGAYLWYRRSHLIANGKKAKAVIFKNIRKQSNIHYPVVRFLTAEKEWITQQLNFGYNPPLDEGTKVTVLYDPDDPTHVEIAKPFQLEILPRLIVAVGVILLTTGTLGYLEFL